MEDFPKLINTHDNSVINVNNTSFSIGRSLSCDHIIESLGVSRFHCVIKKNDDKWILYDRSSNGTVVNNHIYKFNETVDLKNGDVIKLGPGNLDYVFTTLKETENIPEPSNEEVIPADVAEEFQQPFEVETPKSPDKPPIDEPSLNENFDIMENELTCSICSELFIKAVTLSCSHTFCKYCIAEWRKNKSTCPICRKHITTIAPTLVLDNVIEKIISTQSKEVRDTRELLIVQRDEIVGNTASSSSVPNEVFVDGGQIIEIYSDDDDNDDDDEEDSDYDNYYSDDHDYEDYYDRPRGRNYYGGYGRCFICNQAGHWANSCPFKRR